MKKVDYLIIGGSAAGTTAAEIIRSLKPEATIAIVTDENHQQYSRVLLPHYIRGKVARGQVFLKKQEWYIQNKIELLKGVKAESLDAKGHRVKVSSGEEYEYGRLLIAIGGYVVRLAVPGANLGNIFYMRTIEDADAILEAASKSKKAVVVGGGFIGLEFATSFRANNVGQVKILVREPYYWEEKLDEASSKVLTEVLKRNGCEIFIGEEVEHFEPIAGSLPKGIIGMVQTKSGKRFEADLVGIGIGIKSDLSWLIDSGIKVNRAIVTNEYLETNLPDVYAAGDCAEFWDVVFERQHIMGNWANATSQGNAVGRTISGQRTVFETASSYSINFFDGSCSFIGVTDEKFADGVLARGSIESGKMTRIFVKTINNVMRVVGATVINDPSQISPLSTAVKNRIDIAKFKDKLGNSRFDLRELITN